MTHSLQILLIEDSDGDAFLLETGIRKSGIPHILHRVVDGEEALDFVSQVGKFQDAARPDLIITDIRMPRKDGIEFCHEFRKKVEFQKTPVYILVGSETHSEMIKPQLAAESCFFVLKGIDPICTKLREMFSACVVSVE